MPGFGALVVLFLAAFGFLGIGLGSGETTSKSTATATFQYTGTPVVVTDASTGTDMDIGPGTSDFVLHLSHARHWREPELAGRSVRLQRIDYVTDPGFDAWQIVGVHKGDTRISATRPSGAPFRMTVHVS